MNETVSQIQEIVFGVLCDIDDYCSKNGIRYYLSGGSCLGAIRHHGFIPWDDDADIMIPRPDFDRFMVGFEEAYSTKYGVGSLGTDKDWQIPFGRIWDKSTVARFKNLSLKEMGVFVDVFPVDGLPENVRKQSMVYKKLKVLNVLRHAALRVRFRNNEKFRLLKRFLHLVCKPIGAGFFARAMEKCVIKYDFDTSKYVAVSLACHYGAKETIEQKEMATGELVPFEGRLLPVPTGYDVYLHNLYGDYMIPQRESSEKGYTHLEKWDIDFGNYKEE